MLERLMFWKNREPRVESADYAAAEPKRCGNAACFFCREETVEATPVVEARPTSAATEATQATGRNSMPFAPTQILPEPFIVMDDPEAGEYRIVPSDTRYRSEP